MSVGMLRAVKLRRGRWLAFVLPSLIATALSPIMAQVPSSSQLQQLLQQRQSSDNSGSTSAGPLGPVIIQPVRPDADQRPLPASRLEQIMSARAGVRLLQFGYEEMGIGRSVTVPQTGAVQDNYILGPGDDIVVSLRGLENNTELHATVDRNGQVVLPRLKPINASGRSFGSFRRDVEAGVASAYVATSAFVSVGRTRQISVMVSGEVNSPGARLVTGLSSAVDALELSGGVKKTGSLRKIRILRGGREFSVDLYGLLNGGGRSDLALADGDRIVVPPLGRTVAVSGLVRRPGIFELPPGQTSISVKGLLELAGGQEVRGQYRLSALRILADGRSSLAAVPNDNAVVDDSEILFVQLNSDQIVGRATLSGDTGLAGQFSVGARLSDMLRTPGAMGNSPYSLFGILVRKDPKTLIRVLIPFTPAAVLAGREDMPLQSDDFVRPLTVAEAALLNVVAKGYLEKLAADQAQTRNPLEKRNTQDGGTFDELTFSTNDLASASPETQRALLTSLMNRRDPAQPDPGSIESLLARRDETGTSPPELNSIFNQQQQMQLQLQYNKEMAKQAAAKPGATGSTSSCVSPQFCNGGYGAAAAVPPVMANQSSNIEQTPSANFQNASSDGRYAANREVRTFGELTRQLDVDPLILMNFLLDHRARVDGSVRGPGAYFVGPTASIGDLVQVAGGTLGWTDESAVELITTSVDPASGRATTRVQTIPAKADVFANYIVHPRDTLRFNSTFSDVGIGAVTIQGEVRFAGSYALIRGQRLSDLLTRAGGLTGQAYPYGTVFLRKSAAQAEREGYTRAANEIENQLIMAMTRIGNDKIDAGTFSAMQVFVNDLRNQQAVGRVSVVADPSVLAAHRELDPLLEPGDIVFVPPRPSTITVLGQVQQPGTFPYRPGLTIRDYVALAGGNAPSSDDSNTFLVLPDGTARKTERSWLRVSSDSLAPGSTIVVPRDVTPLDLRQSFLDISQIFGQLAVSVASLAVLSKQ